MIDNKQINPKSIPAYQACIQFLYFFACNVNYL